MLGVVVLGAGGHGKVVCDVVLSMGEIVEGFVDDAKPPGSKVLGLPVLGNTTWLLAHPARVALGIGDNVRRAELADKLEQSGSSLFTAVHSQATIAPSATLGAGAVVMARAVVNASALVDRGAIVNTSAVVEHDCVVGAFAHLSPAAALGGGARIGASAHVGLGALVLPSIAVGDRSIVGAGAVVTRDTEAGVVVRGVPARLGRRLSG